MSYGKGTAKAEKRRPVRARIGNVSECLGAISAAIAKRAYEIYQTRGGRPGNDREDWQLAEKEILQPLSCGVLESKDGVTVSTFCSTCGAKDIEEIEVCVEPHRLILAGTRGIKPGCAETAKFYRVLPLGDEIDPASVNVTMAQHGALLEIQMRKVRKESLPGNKAA